MKDILKKLNACEESIDWVKDRTIEQAINECERGDWMLWLFNKLFPDDLQLLTLAKGHCANTVRHLMTDERSIKAVDTAIAFGDGRATREELDAAASAASAAFASASAAFAAFAYSTSAYSTYAAAAYAAFASASYAASAYAASAYSTYAAAAYAAADDDDAKKNNQKQTADICRKYLGEKLIEGCNKFDKK